MVAQSPDVMYIHEPFNPDIPPRPQGLSFDKWFQYISTKNEEVYRDRVEELLRPRVRKLYQQVIAEAGSAKDIARLFQENIRLGIHQFTKSTPLIKDPIALLSAEWLEKVWGSTNVVMIRHPAAFAGSLKVKGWTFPFKDLIDQPEAMNDLFEPYREEIQHFAKTDQHVVKQAAFLWMLLYSVVKKYQERHPEWIFLRHEDLVRNPVKEFKELYHRLGLSLGQEIREKIKSETDPSVLQNWKGRLTKAEISEIREYTKHVASNFYGDDEW